MHPDLSAVVVAYDSGADLAACVAAIRREADACGLDAEIVVVDNASRDGAAEALQGVTLLRNERNRGFGTAANQGFRKARGQQVLFLNPDAHLRPGSLQRLRQTLDASDDAALVAPRLVLPSGEDQDNPRRFYDAAAVVGQRLPLPGLADAVARHRLVGRDLGQPQAVDWVTGAAVLVDRDALPARGPFDERFFLYFEDVDLCRRLAASGRTVVYDPRAVVDHAHGAGSRRQVPWNPLLWRHLQSAALYALRWTDGWWRRLPGRALASAGAALLLRLGLLLLLALPFAVSPAAAALTALATAGPPARRVTDAPLPGVPRAALAGFVAAALLGASWGLAAGFGAATGLGLHAAAHLARALRPLRRALGLAHTTVLIAGDADAAAEVEARLAESDAAVSVGGFVPVDPLAAGGPTPRLASWDRVAEAAADLRAEAVLIAGSADDLAGMAAGVEALRCRGVECAFVLTGANELLQPESPQRLATLPVLPLGAGGDAPGLRRLATAGGRLVAALGLLALAPVAPVLLLAAAATGGSPLLRLPRVGHAGQFAMFKLRTGPDGESGGGALGRALRALHLDELPQLLNVVRGEMALVGPRPVEPAVAARLGPAERARFAVLPGITGMWQLDRLRRWRLEEMIVSDLLYVLRWSPALDLRILAETLLGRRSP